MRGNRSANGFMGKPVGERFYMEERSENGFAGGLFFGGGGEAGAAALGEEVVALVVH